MYRGGGISCGEYFAAGNFAEVTEKSVGNFADHLQCNTVYGLVDPKMHGLICPLPKKSQASPGATHSAGETSFKC